MTAKSFDNNQACKRRQKTSSVKRQTKRHKEAESLTTMIASEGILAREWDTPEEDAAWADL
ncbi:MAG: hypothetical protein KC415_00415 [Anaerolineales bacterium]|nr:hypothetical protein [Anaerolineales bacterium]